MKTGDTMTFEGIYKLVPNPNRKWWQFWKPKLLQSEELQRFRAANLIGSHIGSITPDVFYGHSRINIRQRHPQ